MTIPSILDEPVFLRDMHASFTEALQKNEDSFSMRNFMKAYVGVHASADVSVSDIARAIFGKMVEERPDYYPVIKTLLHPKGRLSETPNNLLMYAEVLQRLGKAKEEDVIFFQKYAFQFAILSEWKLCDSLSGVECLRKSFDQFESLRTYRKELSQMLRIEASHIVQLMKKVLPKHVSPADIQSQAEEVCHRIQSFFNGNLHKPEEAQVFPIPGSHLKINACVKNKQGELICYNGEQIQGPASHIIMPFQENASAVNKCRIRVLENNLLKEVEQSGRLSIFPQINKRLDSVTSFQDTDSFVRSSSAADKLDYQMRTDPFVFSGIELIEISKQVIQTMQKLAERHYAYRFLQPRNVVVRKTESGVEAKVGDLSNIVFHARLEKEKTYSQEILLRESLEFLTKVLLGIDAPCSNMEELIFIQAQKTLTEEQYQEFLSLKKYCLKYGKSCLEGLQDYIEHLRKREIDAFSLSAIEQFIDRIVILFSLYPSLFSKSFQEISFEYILETLDHVQEVLKTLYGKKEETKQLCPCKESFYHRLHRFVSIEQIDLFYEIFSSSFQKHAKVGSDIRFHKGDLWEGVEVPFSFRMQVEKNKVVLTFFFPHTEERSYARAKLAWQIQILSHGVTGLFPIEVIRDDQYIVALARKELVDRARKILKLPGSCKYFSYQPEQTLSYQGAVKKKWEMFSERYKESLSDLDIEDQLHVLEHLLQGIKLIAKKGLVYGELHAGNVGVYRRDDGEARARLLWKTDFQSVAPSHYNACRREEGQLTLESDTYAFIRLMAETLLPDLQEMNWEELDLMEIKALLQEKRQNKQLDLRVAIEAHMEDLILPFLKQTHREDLLGGSIPTIQEIESVLDECFEVLDEPFLYLHPVFAVEPIPTEA